MSTLKTACEIKCPNGCEPFDGEAVILVNADNSEDLKASARNGEINLFMCPACNELFYHDEPLIYIESALGYLVFIFPKSYEEKKDYWVNKMSDDFNTIKQGLLDQMHIDFPPTVVFGIENFQQMLEDDEFTAIEGEVIECTAKEKGYKTCRLKPFYAREHKLPYIIPYLGNKPDTDGVLEASEAIYGANPRLALLKNLIDAINKDPGFLTSLTCS